VDKIYLRSSSFSTILSPTTGRRQRRSDCPSADRKSTAGDDAEARHDPLIAYGKPTAGDGARARRDPRIKSMPTAHPGLSATSLREALEARIGTRPTLLTGAVEAESATRRQNRRRVANSSFAASVRGEFSLDHSRFCTSQLVFSNTRCKAQSRKSRLNSAPTGGWPATHGCSAPEAWRLPNARRDAAGGSRGGPPTQCGEGGVATAAGSRALTSTARRVQPGVRAPDRVAEGEKTSSRSSPQM